MLKEGKFMNREKQIEKLAETDKSGRGQRGSCFVLSGTGGRTINTDRECVRTSSAAAPHHQEESPRDA
jgi:hypothetical protein